MESCTVDLEFFEVHMINREYDRDMKVVCFKPSDPITKLTEFMTDMSGTFSNKSVEFEIHHVIEDERFTVVVDEVVCTMKCPTTLDVLGE